MTLLNEVMRNARSPSWPMTQGCSSGPRHRVMGRAPQPGNKSPGTYMAPGSALVYLVVFARRLILATKSNRQKEEAQEPTLPEALNLRFKAPQLWGCSSKLNS